jgi:hypothetical protein
MEYYEKNFVNYEEAKKAANITGGKITIFLSTNENEEVITVYCVRYKILF